MKADLPMHFRLGVLSLGLALFASTTAAADAPPNAAELAARLSALRQDGSTYVRLKMDVEEPAGTKKAVLQLQIKSRRTKSATELVYQVIWPKERKGESVLLKTSGDKVGNGFVAIPGSPLKTLEGAQMKEGLFGGALTYEDMLENYFAWSQQAVVGEEQVGRTNCVILESKPGKGSGSSYASVKSWVDARRMIPLRIEKYAAGGQLVSSLETTNVVSTEKDVNVPANLTVRVPKKNAVTMLDGSKIKYDVSYTDREFTQEGMTEMTSSKAVPE